MMPKTLEYTRMATPEHSPQYGIYDPDGDGRDVAIVKGDEETAALFAAAPGLLEALKDLIEQCEGANGCTGNENKINVDDAYTVIEKTKIV